MSADTPRSAREDYPTLSNILVFDSGLQRDMDLAFSEIDNLRRWKSEALQVFTEWEEVYDAIGRPGPLGASKAANIAALIDSLRRENARLYRRLEALEDPAPF